MVSKTTLVCTTTYYVKLYHYGVHIMHIYKNDVASLTCMIYRKW
jgi:hypothetical protein